MGVGCSWIAGGMLVGVESTAVGMVVGIGGGVGVGGVRGGSGKDVALAMREEALMVGLREWWWVWPCTCVCMCR